MQPIKPILCLILAAAPLAAQVKTTTITPPATTTAVKPFSATDSVRFMALGRRAKDFMLKWQADSLIAMMTPEAADGLGGVAGAKDLMAKNDERAGNVVKVLAEKMTRRNALPQFWFEANFSQFNDEPLVLRFVFSEDGKLVGIGFGPKSTAKFDG